MQNSSEYPDHLSVLSRALGYFLPTTFLEIAVFGILIAPLIILEIFRKGSTRFVEPSVA